MDGLAAVTARVQQIQGLVQGMQPTVLRTVVPGSAAATASGAAGATAFDQVLAQARTSRAAVDDQGPGTRGRYVDHEARLGPTPTNYSTVIFPRLGTDLGTKRSRCLYATAALR